MAFLGVYILTAAGELAYHLLPPTKGEVVKAWAIDGDDRFDFWKVVVEAQALGADPKRIEELTQKWSLTDEDGRQFADRLGIVTYQDLAGGGALWNAFGAGPGTGRGPTVRDALADYYRQLISSEVKNGRK
jgi:hypothetical protein